MIEQGGDRLPCVSDFKCQFSPASKSRLQIMRQHGAPGMPVVLPFAAPDIQFVRDAFTVKNGSKAPAGIGIFVRAAAAEKMNMVATADLLQRMVIGEVGHVV